jgi:hypothetical protein
MAAVVPIRYSIDNFAPYRCKMHATLFCFNGYRVATARQLGQEDRNPK